MRRAEGFLGAWIGWSQRHAWAVVIGAVLSASGAFHFTIGNLGINTDTADMISDRLAWRQAYIAYKRSFPQFTDTILVVVDGRTPDLADLSARRLAARLRAEPELVQWVRQPGAGDFFERHALLYLEEAELEDLSDNLIAVQPFLGALIARPDAAGVFDLLRQALTSDQHIDAAGLDRFAAAVADGVEAVLGGRFHQLSWQALLAGSAEDDASVRRFVIVKPYLDYGNWLPAADVLERIRAAASELGLSAERGVTVRITGGTALSHEELETVSVGARKAGILALVMVTLVLALGLRSIALVFSTVVTLVVGLLYTAAFAAWAIGQLNMISVAFAVLYIGLGVDYAIHFCLRYRELSCSGVERGAALRRGGAQVGGSLWLCAVTTGIGFFAFVPTEFSGVSELGLISGVAMFISLAVTMTLLPALLTVLQRRPLTNAPLLRDRGFIRVWQDLPISRPKVALGVFLGLVVLAAGFLPRLHFDDNPLNLRDPNSESVATYRDLLRDGNGTTWPMISLAPDAISAIALKARLLALREVDDVLDLSAFVPEAQAPKLDLIEELALVLGLDAVTGEARDGSLDRQLDATRRTYAVLAQRYPRLHGLLGELLERASASPDRAIALFAELDAALMGAFPEQIRRLEASLEAGPVTVTGLPGALRERWVSPRGDYRLEINPRGDLGDRDTLAAFVTAVLGVDPGSTGTPVVHLESGRSVVRAFRQALLSALVLVAGILLVVLRRPLEVALILFPLLLGGLMTVEFMAMLGLPFNFANVIALPLLLGIGVDNGVHIVHRLRSAPPNSGNVLQTSTTRAVVVSALTTICSFGNLAVSAHLGMASMGIVLTIGLIATLVASLLVLPAALALAKR